MFDQETLSKIKSGEVFTPKPKIDLDEMEISDLLDLYSQIESRLPATKLSQMDLEKELVLQYTRATALQKDVLASDDIPANQQAQVLNAVMASLQRLVEMQTKYHTSERLKAIEGKLIRCLEKVPTEYLEEFFRWYEQENS